MNFRRPARNFRFGGIAHGVHVDRRVQRPLIYAQMGHADFRRVRVAFSHAVPAEHRPGCL
jgi:hypothetical protein